MNTARVLTIEEARQEGGKTTLTLEGELDIASVSRFQDAVAGALAQGATSHLTIDLGELSFLDSSGLRALILLRDRAVADGWTLALTRPRSQALSIFRITRADEHLPFLGEPPPS